MCGRFQIAAPFAVLVSLYTLVPPPAGGSGLDPSQDTDLVPRLNIGPAQQVPVVWGTGGPRYGVSMRWGFPATWRSAQGKDPWSRLLINAKAEDAATKRTWQRSLRTRRCLVPATGFYEWARVGRKRYPILFQPADDQPMTIAGLWSSFEREGQRVQAFALLTTRPPAELGRFHHRGPVLIRPEHWDRWLTPGLDPDQVTALMQPPPDGSLRYQAVNTAVNNVRNHSPDLQADWSIDNLPAPASDEEEQR